MINVSMEKGFTLVELLIVVAVLGVLAAFAVPAYQDSIERSALREACMDIYGGIVQARTLAAKNNRDVVLRFNTTQNTYQIFINDGGTDTTDVVPNGSGKPNGIPDGAENWVADPTENIILQAALPNRITFNSANFGVNPFFRFDNKGLPYNSAGTLTSGSVQLKNSKGTIRTINLLMSGHAEIL